MNISKLVRNLVLLISIFLVSCGQQAAIYEVVSEASLKPGDSIPLPTTSEVALTVSGKISNKNVDNGLQMDMATLEKFGVVQYDVDDPFVKENILYAGVLLSDILKIAGADADATTLTLHALDDYSTDMQISDAMKWPIIVATRANGEYMPIDKNGPLISVFPFNDFPEIDHLTYDAMWVWSLREITVK